MSAVELAERLAACGLRVKLWQDRRVYVYGLGRDITAYVEPMGGGERLADQAHIVVETNWRSPHAGLRCKHVKHVLLIDLFHAGALTTPPPTDWRKVQLCDHRVKPTARSSVADAGVSMAWPLPDA